MTRHLARVFVTPVHPQRLATQQRVQGVWARKGGCRLDGWPFFIIDHHFGVINLLLFHHVDHLHFDVVGISPVSPAIPFAQTPEPVGDRTLRRLGSGIATPSADYGLVAERTAPARRACVIWPRRQLRQFTLGIEVVDEYRCGPSLHIVRVEAGPFPPAFSQVEEASTVRRRPSMCTGVRPGCRRHYRQRPCLLCGLPTGRLADGQPERVGPSSARQLPDSVLQEPPRLTP